MSKKKSERHCSEWVTENVKTGEIRSGGSGGGFCLLNTMLLLAAPTAVVTLVSQRLKRQ